ncbi:MAG: hypothetical protein JJ900_09850 [Rhodospirillales bacterium]|nr:hypothetical protein [Rhodospirillales bacterium]MBO6787142.1 hypothetical protein [Rhodospirillales bacterium]
MAGRNAWTLNRVQGDEASVSM